MARGRDARRRARSGRMSRRAGRGRCRIAFVAREKDRARPRSAVLTRVLSGERTTWVARILRSGRDGMLWVAPFGGLEAPRFALHETDAKDARPGDRVLLAPLSEDRAGKRRGGRVSRSRRHRGQPGASSGGLPVRVLEVFGQAGNPEADHRALVWKHRLPTKFSRRARLEADALDEAPGAVDERHRIDPVSYTQLTLPTMFEV